MTKLQGNNAYEMINHANGKLAGKLQQLIEDYGDSTSVSELAGEFISWWYMSFDDPDKDSIGRRIWDKADEIMASLSNDSQDDPNEPIAMTKLEKAGSAVGNVIGKASGVTANATVISAKGTFTQKVVHSGIVLKEDLTLPGEIDVRFFCGHRGHKSCIVIE